MFNYPYIEVTGHASVKHRVVLIGENINAIRVFQRFHLSTLVLSLPANISIKLSLGTQIIIGDCFAQTARNDRLTAFHNPDLLLGQPVQLVHQAVDLPFHGLGLPRQLFLVLISDF